MNHQQIKLLHFILMVLSINDTRVRVPNLQLLLMFTRPLLDTDFEYTKQRINMN